MSIKHINTDDLRRMSDKEGLVIMGCGGDLSEWLDGINDTLAKAEILQSGSRFEEASSFEYKGLTCMLFPFDDVDLNMGKLAMWRLNTHEAYGGTWLSDFVPNYLGGYLEAQAAEPEKPDCPLIGKDGVPRAGRAVDYQIIEVSPNHVLPKLLYRSRNNGAAPKHRHIALLKQKIYRHHLNARFGFRGKNADFILICARAYSEGFRDRRACYVRIENADISPHSFKQHRKH